MIQSKIPCSVYRGGTSRGVFFHEKDLPKNPELKKKIFLQGIDAYNTTQVDGLGGGSSHTSKVVVISPNPNENIDINYTFYQIGVGQEIVDDSGTCGNLMAAVGAFAVEEKLVDVDVNAEYVEVNVYNTNIDKNLLLKVPIENGHAKIKGDYYVQGLAKPGAKFSINIYEPGGGKTGKTLPLGARFKVTTNKKTYHVTFADIVNPCVFVSSLDLGVTNTEFNTELSKDKELLNELESIRCEAAVKVGMAKDVKEAHSKPAIPKIAIVSKPQDYETSQGHIIKKEDVDIVARMLSMGRFHRTFAASCLHNIGCSTMLKDTIPNQLSGITDRKGEKTVRVGHPEGVVEVRVRLTEDEKDVKFVGLDRTARQIMKGELYYDPNA